MAQLLVYLCTNATVVDRHATIQQHQFQVAIADRERQILVPHVLDSAANL
jgi:hypothetical protein